MRIRPLRLSLVAALVGLMLTPGCSSKSAQQQKYEKLAKELHLSPGKFSTDDDKTFARGNCDLVKRLGRASFVLTNEDEVKDAAAAFAAYCPEALPFFYTYIEYQRPEFGATVDQVQAILEQEGE